MKILSLNCQCYKTVKSDLVNLISDYNVDIICLTETWENDNSEVSLNNFTCVSKRRTDGRGGVAILSGFSDKFITEEVTKYNIDGLEAVAIRVKHMKKEDFILVTAYIPPNKTDQMEKLSTMISQIKTEHKNVILTGNLNAKSQ